MKKAFLITVLSIGVLWGQKEVYKLQLIVNDTVFITDYIEVNMGIYNEFYAKYDCLTFSNSKVDIPDLKHLVSRTKRKDFKDFDVVYLYENGNVAMNNFETIPDFILFNYVRKYY